LNCREGLQLKCFETGLIFAGLLSAFAFLPWPEPLFVSGFWICTLVIVKSDLAFYLIPDAATLFLAGLGLLRAAIFSFSPQMTASEFFSALWPPLASAMLAFALFFAVAGIYEWLTGREGLGFGDVKLAGALGVWLDFEGFALALELAACTALLLVLWQARKGKNWRFARLPLGAFLTPAAFCVYVTSSLAWPSLPATGHS
jgi:prepilin signal peptidase PulO-like enzyme (type II secretory pathway)